LITENHGEAKRTLVGCPTQTSPATHYGGPSRRDETGRRTLSAQANEARTELAEIHGSQVRHGWRSPRPRHQRRHSRRAGSIVAIKTRGGGCAHNPPDA